MDMNRIAQISIFVIIAVFLVGGVLITFFLFSGKFSYSSDFKQETNNIRSSVFNCFKIVSKESLNYVGKQGGYSREPLSYYLDTGFYSIPFYYFDNEILIPSNEYVSNEVAYDFDSRRSRCLDFISGSGFNYLVNYRNSNVTMGPGKIIIHNDMDLILNKGNQSTKISFNDLPIDIDSKFYEMKNFASYIVYSSLISNQSLCMDCFSELASNLEFNLEIDNQYKGVLIIDILSNNTDASPFDFRFLMTNTVSDTVPNVLNVLVSKNKYNPTGNLNITAPKF